MIDRPSSAASPEALRTHFLLEDDVVFLNHGSFGACPRPVWESYSAWQRQLERQPVEFFRRHRDLFASARSTLAAYVNVAPNDLSFVVNATQGLNVVARSFPLGPGDEILGTDLEYGALDLTWSHLCQRFGATYVQAKVPKPFTSAEAIVDAIFARVTMRTKAIFLSHITSGTAVILPVKEICQRARAEGILTIIDGAHAPGQVPLDMQDIGADIYAGNCHKWLCAPKGSAFLYVSPEHQEWIESLTISWGWQGDHTFLSRNEQQGTRDIAAFLATQRAIEFQRAHDWDTVRDTCHLRLHAFRERIHERFGVRPIYPNSQDWYRQMALVEVPSMDPAELKQRLLTEHGIEVPCMRHGETTAVRVSVQGYVSDSDLERLEHALVAVAA